MIGAGTQPLLWLLLQLLGPTKEYGIENPGFHRIHAIIKSCDRQIHPILLDEKGIDISSLYNTNSNVAYVTPSHQFPLGIIMPLSRRLELLKWANDCNGYIIEDDYDGEFRYAGKPIPSLQSLDSNERVIYMGTFSKSFLPSLRMGYVVLPPHLLKHIKNCMEFSNKQSLQYNNLLLLTLYKTGIGNVTLIGVVHYIKENIIR